MSRPNGLALEMGSVMAVKQQGNEYSSHKHGLPFPVIQQLSTSLEAHTTDLLPLLDHSAIPF